MRPLLLLAAAPLALLLGLGASQVGAGRDGTPPAIYLELAGAPVAADAAPARVTVGAPVTLLVSASEPATLEVAYGAVALEQVAQEVRLDLLADAGRVPARVRATDAAGNSSEAVAWIEGVPEAEITLSVTPDAAAGDPLGVRLAWRSPEPVETVEIRADGVPLRASRFDGAAVPTAAAPPAADPGVSALAAPAAPAAPDAAIPPAVPDAALAAPAGATDLAGDEPSGSGAPAALPHRGEAWAFAAVPLGAADGALEIEARVVDALGRAWPARVTVAVRANPQPVEELNLSGSTLSVITPEGRALERDTLAAAYAAGLPAPLWREPFLSPIEGRGTSGYGGPRRYAPGGPVSYHQGEDIAAPAGTPVLAANRGVVRVAGMYPIKGGLVLIDHGAGVSSLYFHQQRVDVAVGDEVARGEQIGTVGSTGLSTGPHLHWEMRVFEQPTDPLLWVGRVVP